MSDQSAPEIPKMGKSSLRSLEHLFSEARISVVSCLRWRYSFPWQIPWRTCPDSFVFFPVCGTVGVTLKERSFSIEPGSFLMLSENVSHSLTLERGSDDLDLYALHCHIHDCWGNPLISRLSSPFGRLDSRLGAERALQETVELMQHHPRSGQLRGQSFVRELLATQLANGMTLRLPEEVSDPRVGVVRQLMEEGLSSPELSIGELAGAVKIGVVQLRKIFRRETGSNPKNFLDTLRLREAARRLRQSQASVKDISAACGFSQDHYFHRVFRKAYSCTPSEYRTSGSREL